jgi:predicted RNA-binding protein with TRAM domain
VLIVDEDGASGLARIGERTFVIPEGRKGDVAVVEVTRIGADSAEAVLVERLASGHPVPEATPAVETPAVEESMVGQLFRVEIPEINADGQGVVSLRGKTVVVPGVQVGERVEFRIVEESDAGAVAEIVERLDPPVAEIKPAAAEEEIDYSKAVPKRRAVPADQGANP